MLASHDRHRALRLRDDRAGDDRAVAASLLGDGHSLVMTLGQLEASRGHLGLVAGMHLAGLVLWCAAVPSGVALVVGAIAAEVLVGCRLFVLLEERKNACRLLVATGREELPLAAVARERTRLAAPQHQHPVRAPRGRGRDRTCTRRRPSHAPGRRGAAGAHVDVALAACVRASCRARRAAPLVPRVAAVRRRRRSPETRTRPGALLRVTPCGPPSPPERNTGCDVKPSPIFSTALRPSTTPREARVEDTRWPRAPSRSSEPP